MRGDFEFAPALLPDGTFSRVVMLSGWDKRGGIVEIPGPPPEFPVVAQEHSESFPDVKVTKFALEKVEAVGIAFGQRHRFTLLVPRGSKGHAAVMTPDGVALATFSKEAAVAKYVELLDQRISMALAALKVLRIERVRPDLAAQACRDMPVDVKGLVDLFRGKMGLPSKLRMDLERHGAEFTARVVGNCTTECPGNYFVAMVS